MSPQLSQSWYAIYRWPLLLALVTALGLAAALAGEGAVRIFSWMAMAFPLVVIAICMALSLRQPQNK